MSCEFCESLKICKEIESKSEVIKDGFYFDYRAMYISVAMKYNQERGYSRSGFFALNFCPSCGRKIE